MLLELRPSARRRRTVMVTAVVVYAVFAMVTVAVGGVAGLLIVLSLCAIGLALGYVYLRRSRIVLTPAELAVTGLFGTRRQPLAEVTSIVRATLVPPRGPVVPTLFLLGGPAQEVLFRFNVTHYESYDLDALIERLGRPTVVFDRPMTGAQLDREHPGLVRLSERRPYSFSFAVGCGVVVLVIVIGSLVVFLAA
ncbi:hypothetical protein [Jiangella alba]|uniref:PH domain-containing protein n=1 Tax=Jiangella alba TaxID=561176 RepID=A0A1H5LPI0_9ACTN|nr:hypothetical protein [Jiangella alba]SEE78301.1 hypothetical protein SAMN04488561_2676 [Jiangella alba]